MKKKPIHKSSQNIILITLVFPRGWGLRVWTIFYLKRKNGIGMRSNTSIKYVYNAMACNEKIFVQRKKDFLEMTFRRISFKDYCAFVFVLTKTLKDTTKN